MISDPARTTEDLLGGALLCLWAFLGLSLMGGCATTQSKAPESAAKVESRSTMTTPDFVAVIANDGDTLASLAKQYLDDATMDWFIAEYNDIDVVKPGQQLIIPLKPYAKGGLSPTGYQTVPVLSYHNFVLAKPNKMSVTKQAFEEQMEHLRVQGYHVITMDQLFEFLEFKRQIPKKSVVITIDDGWRSAYDIALPILKKHGYPATLFVYTDLITGSDKTLSWDLIQEMADNGIDIQCHTKTHRNLTAMDKGESFREYFASLEKELSTCLTVLNKKLNKKARYLSYPFGAANPLVVALLKKYGYQAAFTVRRAANPFFADDYRLNRSMIYGDLTLSQFEKNLPVFHDELIK